MNAQRLQAQRGSKGAVSHQSEDGYVDGEGNTVRHSVTTNNTAIRVTSPQGDHGPAPPSRGTEMTEQDTVDRLTANTSPTRGHHTAGSLSESVRPLQRTLGNNNNNKGLSLNIDKSYKLNNNLPTPSKSPRSFRSSFLLPSRGDVAPNSPNRSTEGREKLNSVASSPGLIPDVQKPAPEPQRLGPNYQYFTGNTVFCWGGRLQNTRDKPINVATGMMVGLPAVLFFIFSAPWLWHNISPALPVVVGYIFYVTMSSFIHASASDPGVSLHHRPLILNTNKFRFSLEIFTQCLLKMKMRTH